VGLSLVALQLPLAIGVNAHGAVMLKWPTIAARIYPADTDDNTVRLAEIDENLQRVDLTAVERSMHITERKRIYEEIHGPAKAIGGRAHHRPAGDSAHDNLSFAADTADRTGQNVKTVQRDAKRGAEIGAAELSKVVGTLISNPGTSLASCGWPKRWSPLQNGWRGRRRCLTPRRCGPWVPLLCGGRSQIHFGGCRPREFSHPFRWEALSVSWARRSSRSRSTPGGVSRASLRSVAAVRIG
jgi:hypothetical protein